MKQLIVFAFALGLIGCGGGLYNKPPLERGWKPSSRQLAQAGYGTYPSNYEQIIRAWYQENLRDPGSVRYSKISVPRKEHAVKNQFKKEIIAGFSVCTAVNAKNSYGGYTGPKQRWFLIRNGRIIKTGDPKHHIYIGHPTNCMDGPIQANLTKIPSKIGVHYVTATVLNERLGPKKNARITNKIYRQQRVEVMELQNGWARISRYYDGEVEGVPGRVARWVAAAYLSKQRPVDLPQPRLLKDSRIQGIPKVGEYGLTKKDVMILHRGAKHFINTRRCDHIELGDKSVSKPNTYYVNCGGPRNLFFKPSNLPKG